MHGRQLPQQPVACPSLLSKLNVLPFRLDVRLAFVPVPALAVALTLSLATFSSELR